MTFNTGGSIWSKVSSIQSFALPNFANQENICEQSEIIYWLEEKAVLCLVSFRTASFMEQPTCARKFKEKMKGDKSYKLIRDRF